MITAISKYSFGMYVIHVMILDVVIWILPKSITAPVYMIICFAIVFVISFILTAVISKIPVLKKIVRG